MQRPTITTWAVPAALLLLLVAVHLLASMEWTPGLAAPQPPDTSGDNAITAFFTTPALVYPDIPAHRTPPAYEKALIADIDAARHSIDAALFEYDLPSLSAALIRARQRGVAVRLALDRESLADPAMAFWAGALEQATIPVSWQRGGAFLHSKFVIIDQVMVWTGSWNATQNGMYRNNNNLLRLAIPTVAENYRAEFAQMFAGRFGIRKRAQIPHPVLMFDGSTIENYFAPQDATARHIIAHINGAQHSIRFLVFAFTSDPIADALIERHQAGVTVQGVIERRNARGTGAEFTRLQTAGIDVLTDGNCYTMHHKSILIDEQIVITGSYNLTARAEETNDENLLIITDHTLARQFQAEFERVYRQAQQPLRCNY